jgi:probable DNA metabolism protein
VINIITYIYDGTFTGLLTAVYHILNSGATTSSIADASRFEPDLFTRPEVIITDPDLAGKLFHSLIGKLSKPAWRDIYSCFLSEETGIEKIILDFIIKSRRHGVSYQQNYSDSTIRAIRKISDRVNYEIHRLHGFVRFRMMSDGLYYAPVEPDYNIVELLAPHFTARFADQQWFIHDLRRGKGIYYDGCQCTLVTDVEAKPEAIFAASARNHVSGLRPAIFEGDEPQYQELWNEYFQGIAITERENKRLQRQHMPQRYWKNLIEEVESRMRPGKVE